MPTQQRVVATEPAAAPEAAASIRPEVQALTVPAQAQETHTCFNPLSVMCEEGYSLDQTTNVAAFSYTRTCAADGTFSKESECLPIKCPEPPDVDSSSDVSAHFGEVEIGRASCRERV